MNAEAKKPWRTAAMVALLCALVVSLTMASSSAADEPSPATGPPEFNGIQIPSAIRGPSDPEEFSWRVNLARRQSLHQVSETEAQVVYEPGFVSFSIKAEPAHAADGAPVPTTLRVSEGDILTVIVHHRAGNPEAGGAPFLYPITAGEGWDSSHVSPVIVKGPPDEAEEKAAAEAKAAAASASVPAPSAPSPPAPPPTPVCTVPALHGLTLHAAKARLRAGDCTPGHVRLGSGATAGRGEVVKQSSPVGTQLPAGAPVAVRLGPR